MSRRPSTFSLSTVDRAEALRQLPDAYQVILRLNDLGADRALMSDCLQVEVEAVGPMLEVAQLKLEAVLLDKRASADQTAPRAVQVAPSSQFE